METDLRYDNSRNSFKLRGGCMATTQRRVHVPPPSGFGPLPFSSGVMAGETFYLAGHIGIDPPTRKIPQEIEAEVRLLMESIRNTLGEVRLTLHDLVSRPDLLSGRVAVRPFQCSLSDVFRGAVTRASVHWLGSAAFWGAFRNSRNCGEGVVSLAGSIAIHLSGYPCRRGK
jgi:hypothetical protein